jgi:ankyrin repeat protein
MASSEIEVVSSDSKSQQSPSEAAVIDVFSACAYGDFQKLRKFVEEDGASLSQPDLNGYHAIQWAALNNFPDIVQYIIEVFSMNSCICVSQYMCVFMNLCLYV